MELMDLLRILFKRWWIVTPIFLVTVVCTAIFTMYQDPIYSTTTSFVLSPSNTIFSDPRSFLSGLDVLSGRTSVGSTYSEIATSRRIRQDTINALALEPAQTANLVVKSKMLAGTNVIEITVEGTDPLLITTFANQLGETTVNYVENLYEVYDLKILDLAKTTIFPIKPNWIMNLALAVVLSLALGAGIAFLTEYLDDTLRAPDEISRLFQAPLIGSIPVMSKAAAQSLYVIELPRSPVAEAFRSLRTNLEFASVDQPLKTVLVTSVGAGDGKSSVATNLALALAQSGKKVVLVDADLRWPTVHRFFSIPNQRGLSDIIRGQVNPTEAMYQSAEGRVAVIPAGLLPPNPAEMLGSKKMEHILASLKEVADVVILDSAPLMVADSWVLSTKVDGVVLVVQPGHTTRNAARTTVDQIQRGRARIVGLVLNRVGGDSVPGYYSGYLAGAVDNDGQTPNRNGTNHRGIWPQSLLKLFSYLKEEPGHNHIQPDARLFDKSEPIIERNSTSYNPDIPFILSAISRELSAPSSFLELLQRLLPLMLGMVGGASGSIVVVDKAGQVTGGALAYAGKVFSPPAQQLADIVERGLAGWVIQNREAVLIASTRDDPRWLMRSYEQVKKTSRSAISISLAKDGQAFGAVTLVHSRPGLFTQSDLTLLKMIGVFISFNSAVILPSSKPTS